MLKKYVVRLTDEEREALKQVTGKLKGSSQKVRREQVLLKADADGPAWTDARIAEAFGRRFATIAPLRNETVAWHTHSNSKQRGVDWRFKVGEARRKLKSVYPKIIV